MSSYRFEYILKVYLSLGDCDICILSLKNYISTKNHDVYNYVLI